VSDELDWPLEEDPVVEAYKKDVDVTLLDANLRLTPAERLRKLTAYCGFLDKIRGAAAPVAAGSAGPPR
jgi:hypothetical protein